MCRNFCVHKFFYVKHLCAKREAVRRVEVNWERGEVSWAEVKWEEVGRVEKRWQGVKRLETAEKSCGNWEELRWFEKSCEELWSGGHSWKGVRQDEDEFKEQSWKNVRLHSSSFRQNLLLEISATRLAWDLLVYMMFGYPINDPLCNFHALYNPSITNWNELSMTFIMVYKYKRRITLSNGIEWLQSHHQASPTYIFTNEFCHRANLGEG